MSSRSRALRSLALPAVSVLAAAVVLPLAAPAWGASGTHAATGVVQPQAAKANTANYNGLPAGASKKKTLVIGLDGASLDQITAKNTPALYSLVKGGLSAKSNLYASPMSQTVSGAGWSTTATGVWPDKHKVTDNSFSNPNYAQYPDFMTRIETTNSAQSTLVVGTWNPIPDTVFGAKTDLRVRGGSDEGTTEKAADYLRNGNPDATFVHLDDIDEAGHASGSASTAYAKAHATADAEVEELLEAIQDRTTYKKEDWLIVVTADHGHTPTGGHGGNTPLERSTFVIAQGKGIQAGSTRQDVKIVDIAPTVLAHQGVTVPADAKLDGKALEDIKADDFDGLADQLKPAVDETKTDPTLTGFTHTTPEGWSIDNTRMPSGGVTEWSGWSFTNDDFFTAAERGQGREGNVRSRNVFAVADSDEWDDKSHTAGAFDSTLVSPQVKVKNKSSLRVDFASDYLVDGPQTGTVLVSFDGAAPVVLKNYTGNFNGFESLRVDVPKGAETARVQFRYTGTNSAFWAVDQVEIAAAK